VLFASAHRIQVTDHVVVVSICSCETLIFHFMTHLCYSLGFKVSHGFSFSFSPLMFHP
jgi:hypothetical protein